MFCQVALVSVITLNVNQQDLHHQSKVTASRTVLFFKKSLSLTMKSHYWISTLTFLDIELPRNGPSYATDF